MATVIDGIETEDRHGFSEADCFALVTVRLTRLLSEHPDNPLRSNRVEDGNASKTLSPRRLIDHIRQVVDEMTACDLNQETPTVYLSVVNRTMEITGETENLIQDHFARGTIGSTVENTGIYLVYFDFAERLRHLFSDRQKTLEELAALGQEMNPD